MALNTVLFKTRLEIHVSRLPGADYSETVVRLTPTTKQGFPLLERGITRTHREIAAELGISRSRVFYHEQTALKKMRAALAALGIHGQMDAHQIEEAARPIGRAAPSIGHPQSYSPLHGWLPVNRIVSVNCGSTDNDDVARAFTFLKTKHGSKIHVPVQVSTSHGATEEYRVEAATCHEEKLHLRVWPTRGASRSVKALLGFPLVAIVDSEFDSDAQGEFDIPILIAVFISTREPLKKTS